MGLRKDDTLKILIVEDLTSDQFLLEKALRKMNRKLEIDRVSHLKAAETKLQNERFDLVFMDLLLPDALEYETSLHVVDRYRQSQAFIVMSGTKDALRVMDSLKAGAKYFLAKESFTSQSLQDEIERIVETCRKAPTVLPTDKSLKT